MSRRLSRQVDSQEREARRYGLSVGRDIHCGVLKYRWDIIEADCQKLLARKRGPDVQVSPKNQGTYPESLVNYLAVIWLSCARAEQRPIPECLLHLIAEQLEIRAIGGRGGNQKNAQLAAAAELRLKEPDISSAELSRLCSVHKRSILRWEQQGLLPQRSSRRG